ncbi:MAG: FecR domain-containing protein, partial [Bdellovibrionota bacterium]
MKLRRQNLLVFPQNSEKPKEMDRLKTVIVALVCGACALIGACFLYLDMNEGGGIGQGESMATVLRRDAKVRRKPASSYIWRNILERENVYKRDSLQTGEASAAVVKLNDGSLLEIGENSLIVVDDLEKVNLNFLKGSVVIKDSGGDKKITVGSDGKAKVEELSVRLTKPEALAVFYVNEGHRKTIQLAWQLKKAAEVGPIYFQLGHERGFSKTKTQVKELKADALSATSIEVPPGRYFWRIVSNSTGNSVPLSQVRQFSVVEARALKPLWPIGQEKIRIWGNESAIQFRWQEALSRNVSRHAVEISDRADFGHVISSRQIDASAG